jgi:hypothetical protein
LLGIITVMFTVNFATAQTKKIANASHSSVGPSFNWSSSDNLGAIMDYDKIRYFKVENDSVVVQILDSITIDTIITDTMFNKAKQYKNLDSLELDKKVINVKIQKSSKKRHRKVKKLKERKPKGQLKQEIMSIENGQTKENAGFNLSSLFLLLIVPAGYLMIKKS